MKDLPEIFKNKLDDNLNNNTEVFRSNKTNHEDINSILKSIPVTVYICCCMNIFDIFRYRINRS